MNPLRKHYIKHPKFRTTMNSIFTKLSALGILYWIGASILIFSIVLSTYLSLPEDLRIPIATIVGTVLSAIIIPLLLNRVNARNERYQKMFESNQDFYIELLAKIMKVMQENEQHQQRRNIVELSNYIAEKYPFICINLSARQAELLCNIKDECHLFFAQDDQARASTSNIYDYADRFLAEVRKQGDMKGTVFLNDGMTEKLEMPALGNMNPPRLDSSTHTGDHDEQRTQTTN